MRNRLESILASLLLMMLTFLVACSHRPTARVKSEGVTLYDRCMTGVITPHLTFSPAFQGASEAGVSDHVWSLEEIFDLLK
jgi:hypothetical protein